MTLSQDKNHHQASGQFTEKFFPTEVQAEMSPVSKQRCSVGFPVHGFGVPRVCPCLEGCCGLGQILLCSVSVKSHGGLATKRAAGTEARNIAWFFFYDLTSAFIKKKKGKLILNMNSCEVLLSHLQHICLETAFPGGGLVSSFYLPSLTHGSHLRPHDLLALWHCWTKALASERQGSSGASTASEKVMSC